MLTVEFIKRYFVSPENAPKHKFYDESVKISKSLKNHSKGKFPEELIEIARPNETDQEKQYRKNVFTPVTKTYFSKVVTTLSKMERAEDWSVKFPEEKGLAKTHSFEKYVCNNYPYFDSLLNWFFSFQLNNNCDDPNGVIAVFPLPKVNPLDDSEILRPFTTFFPSKKVIDFKEDAYAVLISEEKSVLNGQTENSASGIIYYMFDTDSWCKCVQVGDIKDFTFTYTIAPHNIGYLPCLKAGGIVEEFKGGEKLYDSFVGDCVPFWDEGLRRYSDLQVQMVLHVHSEKWEIEDTPCKTCNESGRIFIGHGDDRHSSICGSCGGSGTKSTRSPFGVKTIKPATKSSATDSTPIPTPPMGYIQKPIGDTEFIDKQVRQCIENGLAAINMEFLMFEPEVNSGVAKSLDRQEVNAFFYMVTRFVIHNNLTPIYYLIAKWMYSEQMSDEEIMKILPVINVPTDFDILSEDIIAARLQSAKTAKLDPTLITELEIEYAKKEFGDNSNQVLLLESKAKIDPLPGIDGDEKMTILSNKGTTLEKYIISSNLTAFMNRAVSEDEQFLQLPYEVQYEVLKSYSNEVQGIQISSVVPLVDNEGQLMNGSDINTPLDIEAEAKARLKGSVGGVQGILQIQASVASGITSLESAIVLLQEIYGFDPAISKRMLGKPKAQSIQPTRRF